MNRKYKLWICTGGIALVSLLILSGLFLGYISVDLSSVVKGHVAFSDRLSVLTELIGSTQQKIEVTGLQMLRTLFRSGGTGLDADGGKLLSQLRMMVLVPYVAALLTLAFSFVRRSWGYIVTGAVSAAGLAFALVSTLYVFPRSVSAQLTQTVTDVVSDIAQSQLPDVVGNVVSSIAQEGTSELVTASDIRALAFKGLGPAWWIMIIGFVIIAVVAVVAIAVLLIAGKKKKEKNILRYDPEDADANMFSGLNAAAGADAGSGSDLDATLTKKKVWTGKLPADPDATIGRLRPGAGSNDSEDAAIGMEVSTAGTGSFDPGDRTIGIRPGTAGVGSFDPDDRTVGVRPGTAGLGSFDPDDRTVGVRPGTAGLSSFDPDDRTVGVRPGKAGIGAFDRNDRKAGVGSFDPDDRTVGVRPGKAGIGAYTPDDRKAGLGSFDPDDRTVGVRPASFAPMQFDPLDRTVGVRPAGALQSVPRGLTCLTGDFTGMFIPLESGDKVSIGSDPARSNLIFPGQEVSPLHCIVSYDPQLGEYLVEKCSDGLLICNGQVYRDERCRIMCKSGSLLEIGTDENRIRLA